jgi:putative sigma-54 modulation protein
MMTIHFRAVNYTADNKLKEFSKERIEKLSQFYNQIMEVSVFTKVENNSDGINKWAELKIAIPGDDIVVKKKCRTFEEAIHTAAQSAERILKRRKEKVRA